jgi:putative transposase
MPRMYPATVRRQIVSRLRSGQAVAAVAAETGICQATLFRWKRQALIDAGVIEGTPSVEADELAAAHKRIAQLEAELALTRDACELFNAEAVVPPKRRRAIVEGLIARGHSARSACRISGLARSLLQYYRRRPVPDRQIRRLIVADTITEIHQRSRGTYGGRRIRAALLADYDMNVNLKLVRSIMGENGLCGLPRSTRRLPNLIRVNTPADLVNRQFTATQPNELWCTDITEHPARDGKVYCCAILDCFSRMIVARTFSTTADTALVNNAVNMAVGNRRRSGSTILHADHGTQGGFNWSSQHPVIAEVFGGSSTTGSGSGGPPEVEIARASEVSAPRRGSVLGRDRQRASAGRGGDCRRGVATRGATVVPQRWRYATVRSEEDVVGPLPVVR